MDSWSSPNVPALPGAGVPLRLYDSARQDRHVSSGDDGGASMYVCGITPYDATHLGHAATMITFDVINRVWRDNGLSVTYVQNVTDIDDPLLERASRDGEDWIVLAMRETALFREDMEALRILPPAHYVGAVESIPAIADEVVNLLDAGIAYRLDDGTGDVYFDVSKDATFGYESNLTRPEMLAFFAERGGDPDRRRQTRCARSVAVAGRSRRRAGLGGRHPWAGAARLAHRVRGHRPRSARPDASTSRAAATTCCSRTTRCRPRTPRR